MASFLGALAPGEATLVRHVLSCRRCAVWALSALEQAEPAAVRVSDYDAMWTRVSASIETASRAVERERDTAEDLFAELLATPAERRQERLAEPHFHSRTLVIRLIRASEESAVGDPAAAERIALLAIDLVDRLRTAGSGAGLDGLAVGAWCAVADARRGRRDFAGAAAAFQGAACFLEGATDPVDAAGYCLRLGRLRRDERRFDEALALFGRASSLFAELGQSRDQALAQAELGVVGLTRHDSEQAATAFGQVLALESEDGDPNLVHRARAGMAASLLPFAEPGLARRLVVLLRRRVALPTSSRRTALADEPSH